MSDAFPVVCFMHPMHAPQTQGHREMATGKSVIAWLIGVPAGLLTLIYVLAHL